MLKLVQTCLTKKFIGNILNSFQINGKKYKNHLPYLLVNLLGEPFRHAKMFFRKTKKG